MNIPLDPVLVVSAHLDDAVFSAGQFLSGWPGAVVVTMLAGAPNPRISGTKWDGICGFANSQEAIQARRAEDNAALAVLNATPVHLDFLDGQYAPTDHGDLREALLEQVEHHRPQFVVGPLGLKHPDHMRVREALLAADICVPIWLYEDLPYRVKDPQTAAAALDGIGQRYTLEPGDIGTGPLALKIAALRCYESQVLHYEIDEILASERFWRVT